MILPASTIADIKKKSGLSLDKTKDFQILASDIENRTGRHLGVTTLKRMLGYINDDRKSYEYSLNTIALYLGYNDWAAYIKALQFNSFIDYKDDSIYIHTLSIGTNLQVKYLNRIICFKVISYEGQNVLEVMSAENSSLYPGDILFVYKLKKGEYIEAEKLIRESSMGNYKTNAEISSLMIEPS